MSEKCAACGADLSIVRTCPACGIGYGREPWPAEPRPRKIVEIVLRLDMASAHLQVTVFPRNGQSEYLFDDFDSMYLALPRLIREAEHG